MLTELGRSAAILVAIIGGVLGLLGKTTFWKRAWNPFAAPALGVIVAYVATLTGMIDVEMDITTVMTVGALLGEAAVGAHSTGKRIGRAGK